MHEMIGHYSKPRFGGSKAYETGLCTNITVTRHTNSVIEVAAYVGLDTYLTSTTNM